MAVWPRVADLTQRTLTLLLFGVTLYGGYVLSVGGYGVIKRHRERKRIKANSSPLEDAQQDKVCEYAGSECAGSSVFSCLVCSFLRLQANLKKQQRSLS